MTDAPPESAISEAAVLAEWRAAMEGATPGEWSHRPDMDCEHYRGLVLGGDGQDFGLVAEVTTPADSAWIARCSPAGVGSLLALIDDLRAERDEADAEIVLTDGLLADERRLRFEAEAREADIRARLAAAEGREEGYHRVIGQQGETITTMYRERIVPTERTLRETAAVLDTATARVAELEGALKDIICAFAMNNAEPAELRAALVFHIEKAADLVRARALTGGSNG